MLRLAVSGSRTWIWTIAAPACSASSAERAISSGVTGTAGFLSGVGADPVRAQEMMVFFVHSWVCPLTATGFSAHGKTPLSLTWRARHAKTFAVNFWSAAGWL
jgi:hypothetical protein